jgi:hypothetical protein
MSDKPTHTPKPWRVEISKSGNLAILGDETHRQQGFAKCCICLIAPAGQITPIDHANGALIKAAPDFLEAAELHEAALAEPDHDKRETMLIEAGKLRRAAIAKAKS